MSQRKFLIVLGGATATGKTASAIRISQHFHCEVLSADSRQFYREMSIGTAKPSPAELAAAPHHFIDSLSVDDRYSVGDFEREALAKLETIFADQSVAILVGGSGLFLRAVCAGLDDLPEVPPGILQDLEDKLRSEGIGALQQELLLLDPLYHQQVDLQNPHRLLRALSVCRASGQPFSIFHGRTKAPRPFIPIYIWLDFERQALYDRINQRVEAMMADGLLEEARALYPKKQLPPLQAVGYQELFAHFDGLTTLPQAIDKIKQNSRNYAKRQVTWFRKEAHWQRFTPAELPDIIRHIESSILALGGVHG